MADDTSTTVLSETGRGTQTLLETPGKLEVVGGKDSGQVWVLDRASIVIGRDNNCDIVAKHHTLSRRHAEFRYENDRWHVLDLGSAHGTEIRGRKAHAPLQLRNLDIVSLGGLVLKFYATLASD